MSGYVVSEVERISAPYVFCVGSSRSRVRFRFLTFTSSPDPQRPLVSSWLSTAIVVAGHDVRSTGYGRMYMVHETSTLHYEKDDEKR